MSASPAAARLLEARLLRKAADRHGNLCLPPTRATFRRFAPAQLQREGLVARKATALVRLSREWDVERLSRRRYGDGRAPGSSASAAWVRGRPGWSVSQGLGRWERGLVGDSD